MSHQLNAINHFISRLDGNDGTSKTLRSILTNLGKEVETLDSLPNDADLDAARARLRQVIAQSKADIDAQLVSFNAKTIHESRYQASLKDTCSGAINSASDLAKEW